MHTMASSGAGAKAEMIFIVCIYAGDYLCVPYVCTDVQTFHGCVYACVHPKAAHWLPCKYAVDVSKRKSAGSFSLVHIYMVGI